ncbi:MAG: sodium:calcium symporter [Planctomycetes bacterium]|nr:sodium:calcium symporter [Planctomycetota bacterium]
MARERWGSKLGVILAVAGSAIGLGNFLRFPGQAAQNGGGAFLIPYFVALFLLGLPMIWIEWTVGRFGGGFGHSTAPGMFHTLWNKNRFIKYFGVIGIFGPAVIFIYYIYVESWILGYAWFAVTGQLNACIEGRSFEQATLAMKDFLRGYQGAAPNEHFSGIGPAYLFFVLTFATNLLILYGGVQRGIEAVCKYGLPVLFVLGIVLMVRVFTIATPDPRKPDWNVVNGLGFLWNPDWSALGSGQVWLAAAGQIFFTLSVGFGVILTYASYLTPKDDVALSGLTAAAANEAAEVIIGGSIVIPAAFAFFGAAATAEIARAGTFDLGFVTMPLVLQRMAFSELLGLAWFLLLFVAGVTSSISLAQPAIAFLEDEFGLSKKEATLVFGLNTFTLCHGVIFFMGNGVMDELDFWGVNLCLVLFATVEIFLFAWVFGMDRAWTELHAGSDITIPPFYRWIIKYVTPAVLLTIFISWLVQGGFEKIFMMKDVPEKDFYYILGTRLALVAMFANLALLVRFAWKRRRSGEAAA